MLKPVTLTMHHNYKTAWFQTRNTLPLFLHILLVSSPYSPFANLIYTPFSASLPPSYYQFILIYTWGPATHVTSECVGLQCAQSSATTDHGDWRRTGMETRNIGEVVGDLLLSQLILPLVSFQTQPLNLLFT